MLTKIKVDHLKELNDRLQSNGFSWQHDDYFLLSETMPEILDIISQSQQGSQPDQADTCECPVRGFTVYHKQGCRHF